MTERNKSTYLSAISSYQKEGRVRSVGSEGRSVFSYDAAVSPTHVATIAAKEVIGDSGLDIKDIDWIIAATQTSDFSDPGVASLLTGSLELPGLPALELRQLSAGSSYAVDAASKLIQTGLASNILITTTEFYSRFFEPGAAPVAEAARAALEYFGDGCASFLLTSKREGALLRYIDSDLVEGVGAENELFCELPSAKEFPLRLSKKHIAEQKHYPSIFPERIIQNISSTIPKSIQQFCESHEILLTDIERIVAPQIVPGVNKILSEALGLNSEAILDSFETRGFTGSAAIMEVIAENIASWNSGDRVLTIGINSSKSFGLSLYEVL